MSFLAENAGTIGTALVVAVVLFLAVRKIVKDAKSGKPLCCGDCGSGACSACGGACHSKGGKGGECPAMKKTADKISALDGGDS